MQKNHIHPIATKISAADRSELLGQQPLLIWLTGLSGSGKSTLAVRLERQLYEKGFKTFLLDGDNFRHDLNQDLSFSEADRKENLRRVSAVAKLMLEAGLIVVASFIAPYREERAKIKAKVGEMQFMEVFVDCPVEVCEERDVKGLYAKARKGEIKNFTGINAPYEAPQNPDVYVATHQETPEQSLSSILEAFERRIEH